MFMRAALLLLVVACAQTEGRVSLRVTWDPMSEEPLWLRARVERRPDPLLAGSILASADPVLHTPGETTELSITRVPNGDDLVVIVEARREQGLSARALYYGVSEPFSLSAGQDVMVDVSMVLRPPASERSHATLSLLFGGEARERVNIDEIGAATVRLDLSGAARVVLANDTAFDAGLATFELDAAGARITCEDQPSADDPARRWCEVAGWDLTAGLDVEEGVYAVYARLIDVAGYESATLRASVRLDLTPPALLTAAALERVDGFDLAQIAPDAVWAPPGAELRVSFAVSEPLRAAPLLLIEDDEAPLPAQEEDDERTVFEHTLRAPDGPDEVIVRADLVDRAGNAARVDLARIRVDGDGPAVLGEAAQDGIRLLRAPWGAQETDGEAATELRACPPPADRAWDWCDGVAPVFEAGARVEVLRAEAQADGSWACTDEVLTSAHAGDPGGGLHLRLPGDRAMVCVQATDLAGNTSQARLVQRVEWVISYGAKVPGQTIDNPSVAVAAAHLDATREPSGGARELGFEDARALAEVDGEVVRVQARGAWRRRAFEPRPSAFTPALGPAAAYAPTSGEVAVFGGLVADGFTDVRLRTWDLADEVWSDALTAEASAGVAQPDVRAFATMVFEPRRERFVLFGGGRMLHQDGGGWALAPLGDTWEWGDGAWELVAGEDPSGEAAPVPRLGHAVALDPVRGTLILFGGFDGARRLDDSWEWDGRARAWRRLEVPGAIPPARDGHVMVTDPHRRKVFLMGGCADGPCGDPLTDLWAWDGEAGRWSEHVASTEGPSARIGQGVSFDPVYQRLMVFGGARCLRSRSFRTTQCAERYDDVWSFRPETGAWEWQGERKGVGLQGRIMPTQVSLTTHARDWLTGGVQSRYASHVPRGDVWVGSREFGWRQRSPEQPAPAPSVSLVPALAFQPTGWPGYVWMHGGGGPDDLAHDTWRWSHFGWEQVTVGGQGPDARTFHALAYASEVERLYLFGGTSVSSSPIHGILFGPVFDDLWTWDRDLGDWVELDGGEERPSARYGHGMLVDPASGDLLVFGGYPADGAAPLDDLWRWDVQGGGWSRIEPDGAWPPARAFGAFAADPEHGGALLVGGFSHWYASPEYEHAAPEHVLQDTWRWDGEHEAWQPLGTGSALDLLNAPGLAYDASRGRFVLFGATREAGAPLPRVRTWEWHEASAGWADRTPEITPPETEVGRAAVYVPVVDIGVEAVVLGPDLQWHWHAHDVRPGLIWRVPLSASGAGPLARLEAITLDMVAGGRGAGDGVGGATQMGAFLWVWDATAGRWRDLMGSLHVPEAPGLPSWRLDWPDMGPFTTGSDDALTLAVTTRFPSGGGDEPALVAVDYLELRLLRRDGRCQPACEGRACGPDGCGGSCGACGEGEGCVGGSCCSPDCAERSCGGDGCGGRCGACGCGEACLEGACVFSACDGITCGDDGCGGSCGACQAGQACDGLRCVQSCSWDYLSGYGCCDSATLKWCDAALGVVMSEPCALAETCGWLDAADYAQQYACQTDGGSEPWGLEPRPCPEACAPDCDGRVCGYDGCYGSCGACPDGAHCHEGACIACTCDPSWECGVDPCFQPCGEACPVGSMCSVDHVCVAVQSAGCEAPIPITCGDELAGDTSYGQNDITTYPDCDPWSYPGQETVFALTLDEATDILVSVAPEDPDGTMAWLFVVEGVCGGEACVAAQDVYWYLALQEEPLSFTAKAGVPYFLIVDNGLGLDFPDVFTLSVTCLKP